MLTQRENNMERICGCGSQFKCLATGMNIHQVCYGESARQSGDLFGCPKCGATLIVSASPYVPDSSTDPDCTIVGNHAHYSIGFLLHLEEINENTAKYTHLRTKGN
jgi:hypothetical protein